jgi:long-chain acyl-CoA synthetase
MNGSQIEITKDLTIPKLFLAAVQEIRQEQSGHEGEGVRHLASLHLAGLLRQRQVPQPRHGEPGAQAGRQGGHDRRNRPEGLWAEMAAMCAGGVGVWLFQDCMMEEVKYIIDHSDAKFFVGETQEEVDKALSIKDACPKLEKDYLG